MNETFTTVITLVKALDFEHEPRKQMSPCLQLQAACCSWPPPLRSWHMSFMFKHGLVSNVKTMLSFPCREASARSSGLTHPRSAVLKLYEQSSAWWSFLQFMLSHFLHLSWRFCSPHTHTHQVVKSKYSASFDTDNTHTFNTDVDVSSPALNTDWAAPCVQ